jgi:DNA-directed RNA polymerase specialized sigma24 family protein
VAPEERLLRRAQRGDQSAVAAVYDCHAAALYRLAVCLVGRPLAERVVVDVLVTACTRPDVLTGGGSLRTRLVRLTHRTCNRAHDLAEHRRTGPP